ncbi:MAG: carboxylesterase/lipase family protein [Caulobacteraceae bacterium]
MSNPSGVGRREVLGLAAGAALSASAGAASAAAPPSAAAYVETGLGVPVVTPVIETDHGRVQGLVHDGVLTFLGIRYGAPPVGALRWRPPQKPKAWSTIADCSAYGAPAMQMASGTIAAPTSNFGMQMGQVFTTPSELKIENEDCLFLNVWTPGADDRRRPVMVWIHGGGFAFGSGGQPIYDCEGLARHGDVVAVSMNHRLNAFGYLYLGDVMGADYATSGNVGMLDLVACLEWVRDNIARFGGDPGNVTIMGQSGGGAKVSALMAMPAAKGLFHKASIQSGPGLKVGRKEPATAGARKVLAELGVAPGDIKALQAVPAQAIIAAVDTVNARMGPGFGFGPPPGIPLEPIVDGVVLTRDPFDPDAPALSANVPLLIGYVKDELTIFTASAPWFGRMTEADLAKMTAPFGAKGKALIDAWRKIEPTYSPTYLFVDAVSSNFAMAGSVKLAERKAAEAAAGGAPVYMWYLTWETPVDHGVFKTPHTMEIPFMLYSFDKVRTFVGPGPQPRRMADQLCGAWVAFARTGRPDGPLTPHWPPYDASRRATMVFNLQSRIVDDPNSEVRKIVTA